MSAVECAIEASSVEPVNDSGASERVSGRANGPVLILSFHILSTHCAQSGGWQAKFP